MENGNDISHSRLQINQVATYLTWSFFGCLRWQHVLATVHCFVLVGAPLAAPLANVQCKRRTQSTLQQLQHENHIFSAQWESVDSAVGLHRSPKVRVSLGVSSSTVGHNRMLEHGLSVQPIVPIRKPHNRAIR